MMLLRMMLVLAVATGICFATGAPRVTHAAVHFVGCSDCAAKPPSVSVWDEGINAPLTPAVSRRTAGGFDLRITKGYYDVRLRSAACSGERFLGVLTQRSRRFDVAMQCIRSAKGKSLGFIRLVDEMRGLGGTIPRSVQSISMWPAQGGTNAIAGTITGGAYYFDEANCAYCVVAMTRADGTTARIGIDISAEKNFTFIERDISDAAVRDGESVQGSPFNAPETMVEGPKGTIWILDRLGNRVATIEGASQSREFDLPTPFSNPGEIVGTPRFVWVSERNVGKIVRFGINGERSEFPAVDRNFIAAGFRIAGGGDRGIWFTDGWSVGAINDQGSVTYRSGALGAINNLAVAQDGRVWIVGTEEVPKATPFVATLGKDGHWQRFTLEQTADLITVGKGGVWIAGSYSNYLAFVDGHGVEKVIQMPIRSMDPKPYAVDDADNLWFSDRYGNVVGRATPSGSLEASYTLYGPARISDMRLDQQGDLWLAEPGAHVIERYGKSLAFPPRGVEPRNLLFDSKGDLWYSDRTSDIVGVIGKNGASRCYAFALSHIRNCATSNAYFIQP
jgi:streptogramin lyase